MISSKEKGFKKIKMKKVITNFDQSEFVTLPSYVCYKAALLREKILLGRSIVIILILFTVYFVESRYEIYNLYARLRSKEYILAPGVQSFTSANPQTIPDKYLSDAVNDFVSTFGTVNMKTVNNQYESLKRFMTPELRIKFDNEVRRWVNQVEQDDVAQILKPSETQIKLSEEGLYKVSVNAKADLYSSGDYLGVENQVINMTLELVPPESGKRWFLQITEFSWKKVDSFSQSDFSSK